MSSAPGASSLVTMWARKFRFWEQTRAGTPKASGLSPRAMRATEHSSTTTPSMPSCSTSSRSISIFTRISPPSMPFTSDSSTKHPARFSTARMTTERGVCAHRIPVPFPMVSVPSLATASQTSLPRTSNPVSASARTERHSAKSC